MVLLKTINDVCAYTSEVSTRVPEIPEGVRVVAEERILPEAVVSSLSLPASYVRVAENYRLEGVSIGYFSLWPSGLARPLSESLIEENSRQSIISRFHNKSLVAVASYEANPICVVTAGAREEGEVVVVDIATSPVWREKSIASDLEIFLLLAANIYKITDEFADDPAHGLREVGNFCAEFRCSSQQTIFWNTAAHVLLS